MNTFSSDRCEQYSRVRFGFQTGATLSLTKLHITKTSGRETLQLCLNGIVLAGFVSDETHELKI